MPFLFILMRYSRSFSFSLLCVVLRQGVTETNPYQRIMAITKEDRGVMGKYDTGSQRVQQTVSGKLLCICCTAYAHHAYPLMPWSCRRRLLCAAVYHCHFHFLIPFYTKPRFSHLTNDSGCLAKSFVLYLCYNL